MNNPACKQRAFCTSALLMFLLSSQLLAADVRSDDITFNSHDVQLSGTVVYPLNQTGHVAAVFVHGSGPQKRNLPLARALAAKGIVTLVYDKRGVGESGGTYEGKQRVSEHNVNLLAADAAAALQVLRQHPQAQAVPAGLIGISQAGWLIPLAAEQEPRPDFMVIWSGPVSKVSEEDIYSRYTRDLDGAEVPSYEEALRARKTPYVWPDFLGKDSNPVDSLKQLQVPGLWVFGAQDGSIPVDLSVRRLKALAKQGHPYEYVLFSSLGHNNISETLSTVTDWVKRLVK
ncbi:alpha/beta hydrolase family protein [Marinicella sediminis]|uniref:Alpha/beta hydrolase family protein n=2 Tax=Marinicella sediminis TaxID=1792834 RepID=A0ABV7J6U5_9GAMM